MKLTLQILILSILDFIVIWTWFYYIDPDPSISIAVIIIYPLLFFINLLAGVILWITKKRNLSLLFIINSVVTVMIASFLWSNAIRRHQNRIWISYSFSHNTKNYYISIHKPDFTFMITESVNPGSFSSFQEGVCNYESGKIILKTDSTRYSIEHNILTGFTKNKIQLKKE
ncbi:hypothetical protein J2795_000155 [Chryseobacterium bernardetii]|uniref:Uncharacterized protein n=2 Tax=Chryseobacterium TaxID=59732 RepID=A0A543ENR6_9FLAO|nr:MULTISPECIES: hypothetical protein [Chryseobacterium]MDR6369608.1 hypothetical protein [Chryseobacterium vietnamense]MDR6439470.1 hypothetical protein [Chryseobacterium bernardetii]TQM23214.1 hypothetical protein FB551_2949 [Chryseobacterium aquifrigidense]